MNQDTFKCACERCDGHLEVSVENAGMTVECPHCRELTRLLMPPSGRKNDGLRLVNPTPAAVMPVRSAKRSSQDADPANLNSRSRFPGLKRLFRKGWGQYSLLTLVCAFFFLQIASAIKRGEIYAHRRVGADEWVYRDKDPVDFYLQVATQSALASVFVLIWLLVTVFAAIHQVRRACGLVKPGDTPLITLGDDGADPEPFGGANWNGIPPPDLVGPGAMAKVDSFISKHGWVMHTGTLNGMRFLTTGRPISGLPWEELVRLELPALTRGGILYVLFSSSDGRMNGVAYNPDTRTFPPQIVSKPLSDQWFAWSCLEAL